MIKLKNSHFKKVVFLGILFLALTLRFYKLGQVPLSLDWDEVSNAYNAYSILKTAKDEYGTFFPLNNRSFDDYKPPLYMYLNIPSIAVFGLSEFSARLPSAFFGFLTVPTIYFLTRKLFKSELIALISMGLLSISPWHIQFSRVGFEANLGLFMTSLAVTIFFYGFKNQKLLALSAVLFSLSIYGYHSQRVFTPLILLTLVFIFRSEIKQFSKRYMALFIVILTTLTIPLIVLNPPKAIFGRFEAAASEDARKDIEESISLTVQDSGFPLARIIHNRRAITLQRYASNYLSYFDLNYLFIKGDDNFRHHIDGMGMLYLFELPAILYGIFLLIKNRSKNSSFILLWLIISPIAAVPATPNPHAVRSLVMIVPLEIISAYAIGTFFNQKIPRKKILLLANLVLIFISFSIYIHNYFSHYPYEKASFWQYGYKEAVLESQKLKNDYSKIIIDGTLEQAYIFWLFYTNFDPRIYQSHGSRENFDKFYFHSKRPQASNELFISANDVFPAEFEVIKIIYDYQGKAVIKIGHPR